MVTLGKLRIPAALTALVAVAFAGCASIGGGGRTAPTRDAAVDTDAAVEALQAAQVLYDDGEFDAAAAAADSLYASWRSAPSLAGLAERALLLGARANESSGMLGRAGDQYAELVEREPDPQVLADAVVRYAEILSATGRPAEAVGVALDHPGHLTGAGLDELRRWVAGMSMDELQRVRDAHSAGSAEARIAYVQLAELLAAEGRLEASRRVAQSVLDAGASEPERSTAELLVALEDGASMSTARIGAILPMSGELASVGELMKEGIDLALEEYARNNPAGFDVELVVRDDRSDPETAAALVEELEREGVVAIVGPLRSESFASAARARVNPRLPIVSPTATEVFGAATNAYTLYARDQRERDVANDLARWAVEELGLRRGAVLRPTDPALARAATFFARAFEEAGGTIVASASYGGAGSTTFQEPIQTVAAARPDVVYAPAADGPAVLTLAPQLVYYGLDRSIVLGSEAWADPAVLRRLEGFAADYRVVGLWADRVSAGTEWQEFVRDYERKYRRSFRDNMVPALAHDAAYLVLAALEAARLPIPAALSARLSSGLETRGVTGLLLPDPESSTVRRRTEVHMLLSGTLTEPDRSVLLNWLAEARAAPPRGRLDRR